MSALRKAEEWFGSMTEFRSILECAEGAASSAFEVEFVSDMTERVRQYGHRTMLTPRQVEMLRKIAGEEK